MTTAAKPGLRERKKMRTRYAIISTAVTLFVECGYDETTVAEIAEAAEVAPRTFFRYFATKDEVALALITEVDEAIFPALEARPAEEPPVTALANAARTVVEQLMQADDSTGELWTRIVWLLENSPPLLAAHYQRALSIEDRLARKLAEREGVDPDTDLRPFLVVGAVGTALRAAHHHWAALPQGTAEDLARLREHALQMLNEPLDRHWAEG
ncbi:MULTISPECIES: TetR family transcriptional regulator [unclassified Streptomyces]|uniref:TetR/AcrR family transcriptional regulator n=1 Tax=unclassified Streptomyces TaxID=2593676 RepID=UPI00336A22E2